MSRRAGEYDGAAGGPDALRSVARAVLAQGEPLTATRALLRANQPDGFDCPGCAWPDPRHTSSFEFCENGAKAVAWEATGRTVGADFFARWTVAELRRRDDHWLESQGRLTQPLRYDAASDRYVPVAWEDAFVAIGAKLRSLGDADAAAFYTSGRASNEAAFLWQLFARLFGTNNLPDCSNLCHEATSVGLPESIGVGKGTVTLEDFALTDAVLSFGHNPGSNHPRMLGTLREVALRGKPIVVFNPMRERGLERFRSPQHATDMLHAAGVPLATHYFQPRVGSDHRVLQGLMKRLVELDRESGGVLDRAFLAGHTSGLDGLLAELDALDWSRILGDTGLDAVAFDIAARVYAAAPSCIVAYGMGITQHRHGTRTVQQLANLLLLRGNVGRAGAGICPVRGHSNVQGDRTVGINERPPPEFLDRLEAAFGRPMPRRPGVTVVEALLAMREGGIRALLSLGGNVARAAPDPAFTEEALARLELTVGIHTKLNRSHLCHRGEAWILPCLGRTDADEQAGGPQAVTVEDSMSMVHASRGFRVPVSPLLRSEPSIVAGLAAATLGETGLRWQWLVEDYDRIRDLIEACVPGFDGYNARIRKPGGFRLPVAAASRLWRTAGGLARFLAFGEEDPPPPPGYPLRLTTIRSHDQYNTTVYGMDDRYRGIHGRRDVVFMNVADLAARGLRSGDAVDVVAPEAGGAERRLPGWMAVAYDVAPGCCAAYYPEANGLVALDRHDPRSRTPAYKSVPVEVRVAGRDTG